MQTELLGNWSEMMQNLRVDALSRGLFSIWGRHEKILFGKVKKIYRYQDFSMLKKID